MGNICRETINLALAKDTLSEYNAEDVFAAFSIHANFSDAHALVLGLGVRRLHIAVRFTRRGNARGHGLRCDGEHR